MSTNTTVTGTEPTKGKKTKMPRAMTGFILVILFASLAFLSLKYALSNTYLHSAQNILGAPPGANPTQTQVAIAKSLITRSLELAPHDSDNLDLAGRISYWQSLYANSETQQKLWLAEARSFHQKALQNRPNWAYSHVNLVYSLSGLGEFGKAYNQHFDTAYQLGKNDRAVTLDLVYLGVTDWQQSSGAVHEKVVALTEDALKLHFINANGFRSYLESQNQLFRICAHLGQFEEKMALCNS